MGIKRLTIKIFIILTAATSAFSIFFISQNQKQYHIELEKSTEQSLNLALEFDLAIRKYVTTTIRPAMTRLIGPDEFIPETMSTSFVARSIFEDVQKKFPNFILKFSSKNPRNPKNLAGIEEREIIDFFNKNPRQNRLEKQIYIEGQPYQAVFQARRAKISCMPCHGDPAKAPASLVARYGNKAGFHFQPGSTIAIDTIAIKLSKLDIDSDRYFKTHYPILLLALLGLFFSIFLGIKFLIINRIRDISRCFNKIANAEDYSQINHIKIKSKDEIGNLAQSFNLMADKFSNYHQTMRQEVEKRNKTNKQLKKTIKEYHNAKTALQELNDNQEALIAKRTAELSRANSLLEAERRELAESNQALAETGLILKDRNKVMLKERQEQDRLFDLVEKAKREWELTMDCIGDMVLLINNKRIKRCNKAVLAFTGRKYDDLIDKIWFTALTNNALSKDFSENKYFSNYEYYHEESKRWFYINSYNLDGELAGEVITLHDFTAQQIASQALAEKNKEVQNAYAELKQTQSQLLQQEKMASIGQLAAGVAHEINNPVGFISSNLRSLNKYVGRLNDFIRFQAELFNEQTQPEAIEQQKEQRQKLKLDFIQEDIVELIDESLDGCERVKKIVQDLKGFSRVDESDKQQADINECLETTLNIVWNELKYKAKIEKEYGIIAPIDCHPQQLNQVFMNLLINAVHAIEKEGIIKIKTWQDKEFLYASISDSGQGISPENQKRIFEPFFTTKEVGKGTGLGLSIVYDIITKNHNGDIEVESTEGQGTTFTVKLPIK